MIIEINIIIIIIVGPPPICDMVFILLQGHGPYMFYREWLVFLPIKYPDLHIVPVY